MYVLKLLSSKLLSFSTTCRIVQNFKSSKYENISCLMMSFHPIDIMVQNLPTPLFHLYFLVVKRAFLKMKNDNIPDEYGHIF